MKWQQYFQQKLSFSRILSLLSLDRILISQADARVSLASDLGRQGCRRSQLLVPATSPLPLLPRHHTPIARAPCRQRLRSRPHPMTRTFQVPLGWSLHSWPGDLPLASDSTPLATLAALRGRVIAPRGHPDCLEAPAGQLQDIYDNHHGRAQVFSSIYEMGASAQCEIAAMSRLSTYIRYCDLYKSQRSETSCQSSIIFQLARWWSKVVVARQNFANQGCYTYLQAVVAS